MGFVLGGTVVDIDVLKGAFIKFVSAWGVISTTLVGLGQSELAADGSL